MPRIAWSRLFVLLIALPLGSCLDDEATCPTCPPAESGRIEVVLPLVGEIDSVHVTVNGGARTTVRPGQRRTIGDLAVGVHSVQVVRWYGDIGTVTSRISNLYVTLAQGERRFILFHNDFPRVVQASPPGPATPAFAVAPSHRGWASA